MPENDRKLQQTKVKGKVERSNPTSVRDFDWLQQLDPSGKVVFYQIAAE
jgi:hypothetical protein